MRKTAVIAMAFAAVLAVAGVAFASNTYVTTASVTPKKSGTKTAPKAVKVVFSYTVGTTDGTRPSVITNYNIKFGGIKSYEKAGGFKTCTFAQVSSTVVSSACNAALIGTGNVENQIGGDTNPNDKNACHLDLRQYALPNNHMGLRLDGSPTNPKGSCIATTATAIDAKFVSSSSGDSLQFSVPSGLQHPLPGLSNAVINTASTLPSKLSPKKLTFGTGRHKKHLKVGLLSSISCPRSHKRVVSVTYTDASGAKTNSSANVPCTS